MCDTCGCNSPGHVGLSSNFAAFRPGQEGLKVRLPDNIPDKEIRVAEDILGNNDRLAEENRRFLSENKVFSINMVGSPGSGKTSLIVKTIEALKEEMAICVIEGDQFGSLDADRIAETGSPVVQINTGNGCHLDACSVGRAIRQLDPVPGSLLIIENVGNLVCPAMFDLGEHMRAVVLSVTEGDDKPVKYAPMFHGSSICVINKIDLIAHIDFEMGKVHDHISKINHHMEVFNLSATTGEGISQWLDMIRQSIKNLQT